ncbi:MAG TPA: diversity-generating retroelement protein Avd [Spirochaetia bacterium]|nr:diversity-generating retroelement protein Avd [Spirochaetia bacterium]HRV29965.1 diversity-generating retroelement protein Avd [Spirochaetia bacterium]
MEEELQQPYQQARRDKEEFILQEKIADMIKYGKRAVAHFPRREKQTADEIRTCMLTMLRLAIKIKKKYYKKTTLQELDEELEVLRVMLRVAVDKDYYDPNIAPPLPFKKYEYWSRLNDEIGRIIGGYIKSQK